MKLLLEEASSWFYDPRNGRFALQHRRRVAQVEDEKGRVRELEGIKRHLDGEAEDLQNQVWRGYCILSKVNANLSGVSLLLPGIAQDFHETALELPRIFETRMITFFNNNDFVLKKTLSKTCFRAHGAKPDLHGVLF